MERRILVLNNERARYAAHALIEAAPEGYILTVQEPTRTADQNAKLWPMLSDVSRQVEWYGRKLADEDWKHVFTASLRKLDVVPNLDGTGFVALGQSTSKMGKRQFADLIELIYAFGSEHGVIWSEPVDRRVA